MAVNVNMENINTKEIKSAVIGFSWTSLLFGAFVPLLRGDILWFVIFMILSFMTLGLAWLVVPFVYNKMFIKKLVEKGYIPADDFSKNELKKRWML